MKNGPKVGEGSNNVKNHNPTSKSYICQLFVQVRSNLRLCRVGFGLNIAQTTHPAFRLLYGFDKKLNYVKFESDGTLLKITRLASKKSYLVIVSEHLSKSDSKMETVRTFT